MTDWGLIKIRLSIVAMLSLIYAIVERDYQIAFMSNKVGSWVGSGVLAFLF